MFRLRSIPLATLTTSLLLAACSTTPFGTTDNVVLAACEGDVAGVEAQSAELPPARALLLKAMANENADHTGKAAALYALAARKNDSSQIVIACPGGGVIVDTIENLAEAGEARTVPANTQPPPPASPAHSIARVLELQPITKKAPGATAQQAPAQAPAPVVSKVERQVAATTPPTVSQKTVPPKSMPQKAESPAPVAPVWVQLAAYRQKDNLERGWRVLSKRHAGLLDDVERDVRIATVKGKRYLRLGIKGLSKPAAKKLCRSLKDSGQYCLIRPR